MIVQVDVGGVLAVTQLLSQFGTTEYSRPSSASASVNPFSNPTLSGGAVAMDERVGEWNDSGANGVAILSTTFPRHSSLPSSPRYRGEEIFPLNVYQDDIPRVRSLLFQVCDSIVMILI